MYCEKRDSVLIKESLKNLCCSNGWCYGIVWGFHHGNSLLLTLKDAYYEEQMGALIDNMLLQVHVLGEGVIGQAAFAKNHKWINSDAHHEIRNNPLASFESLEVFQAESDFNWQFCMGIKTIAIISMEPWGVVQLGSTHKIAEAKEFVDQVKELFQAHTFDFELSENEPCSSDNPFSNSLLSFVDQKFQLVADLELGFIKPNDHSLVIPSQLDELVSELGGFFDYAGQDVLHLPHGPGKNEPFSKPNGHEFHAVSGLSHVPTDLNDCIARVPSGLLALEDQSQRFSPFPWRSKTSFYYDTYCTDKSYNLPTDSMQSCVTSWSETLVPIVNSDKLNFGTNESSEKCVGSEAAGTSNTLFSKLGLDGLVDSSASSACSFAKSRYEDQSSSFSIAKRRKIDHNYSWSGCQEKKIQDTPSTLEVNSSSSKRQEEPTKAGEKKAKPGTKPRPKDRQMIQDRLAELRELIPNGEKMSIDRLLERTIRHLNFMSSLTKHARSMKQIDNTKSVTVQKSHSKNGCDGVTWACEVSDQTMVCPLMVEDLSTPGQMLIEIICEEEGFFLEIVDIICSFSLIIIKGAMELRETKMWAHFIVEATGDRRVTRHAIFSSLIQFIQMTSRVADNSTDDRVGNIIGSSSGASLFNNYQSPVWFPVYLADSTV